MKESRLKIRLTPAAEQAARGGHPWIFADKIKSINREGETGELAVVYDRRDRFLDLGLYDPHSQIRLRLLHIGDSVTINDVWWIERFRSAVSRRATLFGSETNGYRLINGESDGLPGLVLDRYADTCVVKCYSTIWLPMIQDVLRWIAATCTPPPRNVVLRLSRNIQEKAGQLFDLKDGTLLQGDLSSGTVIFSENGKRFEADVLKGQKTGFFLDQRENRQRIGELAQGKDVLNVFSHTGGFSVYAAVAGARSTTDVDISAHALDAAKRNMALNTTGKCQHQFIKADVFAWFPSHDTRYDIIIIDPPSLARRQAEKEGAIKSYSRLIQSGLSLLRPGGFLLAASCTAHLPAAEFFSIVRGLAQRSGRLFIETETRLHAPDHEARIPEAHYLKAIGLRVEN